jgi:hypothetical protein
MVYRFKFSRCWSNVHFKIILDSSKKCSICLLRRDWPEGIRSQELSYYTTNHQKNQVRGKAKPPHTILHQQQKVNKFFICGSNTHAPNQIINNITQHLINCFSGDDCFSTKKNIIFDSAQEKQTKFQQKKNILLVPVRENRKS